MIGGLLSLIALVADRNKWGRIWTGYSLGASSRTTESVGMKLKRLGLRAEIPPAWLCHDSCCPERSTWSAD